jgi:hypothetical protein
LCSRRHTSQARFNPTGPFADSFVSMAVVKPKPTKADRRQMILKLVIGTVVGVISAGVIGPIIAAIVIGEIWGH